MLWGKLSRIYRPEPAVCHIFCVAQQTMVYQTSAFPSSCELPYPSFKFQTTMSPSFVFSWRCYLRWSYWPFWWVTQFSWVCLMYTYDSTWDVEFLAISINKDVTAISSFDPPNVKFWALSVLRKENDTCYLGVIKLQPFLPWALRKSAGDQPQTAEVHIKGMISVSPDSCIF